VLNGHGNIQNSFLYDPSGSYRYQTPWGPQRGTGGIQYWDNDSIINITDYYLYQLEDGPDIMIHAFNTTEEEELRILAEAKRWGGGGGFDCTKSISYILSQLDRFRNIEQVTFPTSLSNQLSELK